MKIHFFLILIPMFCVAGYDFLVTDKDENWSKAALPLIKLTESAQLVRALILQDKLKDLLEEYDTEQLAVLLDNVSPAKMAFEIEVLSTTVPLVVVYYFEESSESDQYMNWLGRLAIQYNNRVKFVVVDTEKLFSLAQDAGIEHIPTVLLVKDREVVDRLEDTISLHELEKILAKYLCEGVLV